jgi:hypothetical protein
MSDPLTVGAALSAAGSSVGLLNNIVAFVKAAEKAKQDPRLADVLARIPAEAFILAGQYVTQVQDLRSSLIKADIDLSKTQRELLLSTSKWHFGQRRLLSKFSANTDALEVQLSRFMDDALSVADCCGDDDFVIQSFADAEELRIVLHRETDPSLPVGDILKALEGRARDMRAALGDMTRQT